MDSLSMEGTEEAVAPVGEAGKVAKKKVSSILSLRDLPRRDGSPGDAGAAIKSASSSFLIEDILFQRPKVSLSTQLDISLKNDTLFYSGQADSSQSYAGEGSILPNPLGFDYSSLAAYFSPAAAAAAAAAAAVTGASAGGGGGGAPFLHKPSPTSFFLPNGELIK